MRKEDVKIGMKVIAHRKTIGHMSFNDVKIHLGKKDENTIIMIVKDIDVYEVFLRGEDETFGYLFSYDDFEEYTEVTTTTTYIEELKLKHIITGTTTTVLFDDGREGVAKLYYKDTFNPYIGFAIAYDRALKMPVPKKLNKDTYDYLLEEEICINIRNKDDFKILVEWLEKFDILWYNENLQVKINTWDEQKTNTVVYLSKRHKSKGYGTYVIKTSVDKMLTENKLVVPFSMIKESLYLK